MAKLFFKDSSTEGLYYARYQKRWSRELQEKALFKIRMMEAARTLDDLRFPPGNRLEALTGDRFGQWSIRVNRQWRLCFRWEDGAVLDLELVDYHD